MNPPSKIPGNLPPLADSIEKLADALLPKLRAAKPTMLASAAIRAIGVDASRDIAQRISAEALVRMTASVLRKRGSIHHPILESALANPRKLAQVEKKLSETLLQVRSQCNKAQNPQLRMIRGEAVA